MGRRSTTQGLPQPATLSLSGRAARASRSVHAGTGAPRPNTRPWGIDAILARAAGGLGSGIAARTALAPGGLSSISAAACGSGGATCSDASACSTARAACASATTATSLSHGRSTKGE